MRTQAPLHHVSEAHPAWFIVPLACAAVLLLGAALLVNHEALADAALAATPAALELAAPATPPRDDAMATPEVPHVQAF